MSPYPESAMVVVPSTAEMRRLSRSKKAFSDETATYPVVAVFAMSVAGAFNAATKFATHVAAVEQNESCAAVTAEAVKVNATPAIVTVSPVVGFVAIVSVAEYGRLFE